MTPLPTATDCRNKTKVVEKGCQLCPRRCSARRRAGERGICGADDSLRVARAALHFWEEPPISGWGADAADGGACGSGAAAQGGARDGAMARGGGARDGGARDGGAVAQGGACGSGAAAQGGARDGGAVARDVAATRSGDNARAGSGAVFFCNCPLHCVYCQNQAISSGLAGAAISVRRLADIFCELQAQGAQNINLVTPTQYLPQIRRALTRARRAGLHLPIVYNTSGYERPELIATLAGCVDIFLTDFRYATAELATRYSQAPDYPQVALAALQVMRQVAGDYRLDSAGILKSGIIVRFLLLPGHLEEARQALATVFSLLKNEVCYSLMNQFTPLPELERHPELNRSVSDDEYDALIDFALELGITNSFMQEGATASESYIPPFDLTGVLVGL
ncbi:MAG: radical SAM protein [Coriobacteriales bacterium]|nr:radical SAM protein [Coriobacteriales bacterium]